MHLRPPVSTCRLWETVWHVWSMLFLKMNVKFRIRYSTIFSLCGFVFILILAISAYAVKIMGMTGQDKPVGCGNFPLYIFDPGIRHLNYFATVQAYQMIMMGIGACHFIAGYIVAELDFPGQTRIAKQLQGAVDCCLANAGIGFQNMLIKFLKRMMAGKFKK